MSHHWTEQEIRDAVSDLRASTTVAEAAAKAGARQGRTVTPNALKMAMVARDLPIPSTFLSRVRRDGLDDLRAAREGGSSTDALRSRGVIRESTSGIGQANNDGISGARVPTETSTVARDRQRNGPVDALHIGTGGAVDNGRDPIAPTTELYAGRGGGKDNSAEPEVTWDDPSAIERDRVLVDGLPEHLDSGTGDTGIGDERLRVIVPDSHGYYQDPRAVTAFLGDLHTIDPDEIVMIGDHVDVSGLFSGHMPSYVAENEYSYEGDITATEAFLDAIQKRAPRARIVYLEGNHEAHVERWISRTVAHTRDAEAMRALQAPEARLRLKERGIRFVRRAEFHDGLSVRGTIRLGKCHFTHGSMASKFATAAHLAKFGACVVHGHTHRAQAHVVRTVASDAIGAWCPGTLSALQPLYRHTDPTDWTHGYGLQAVAKDGRFLHMNLPIVNGWSGFRLLLGRVRPAHMMGAA